LFKSGLWETLRFSCLLLLSIGPPSSSTSIPYSRISGEIMDRNE